MASSFKFWQDVKILEFLWNVWSLNSYSSFVGWQKGCSHLTGFFEVWRSPEQYSRNEVLRHRKQCILLTVTAWLVLYREVVPVHSDKDKYEKVVPVQDMKAHGRMTVSLHSFWRWALEGVSDRLHAPAPLFPGKVHPVTV